MPHVVNCNLCGADDFDVVFPKGVAQLHRIVRCKKCELMYANPQELVDCERIAETLEKIDLEDRAFAQYFQKQHVQIPDNLRALEVLNQLAPKKGKLFEIGSYLGLFADHIRKSGWDITCMEPSHGPAEYSRQKFKLNVIEGLLPQPTIPSGSFDAVVMLHVIEHMPDPGENLAEIRRIMKPGGILVVETPRFDSLMFKLMGRRERSLSNCNGHIYFFTVPTLTKLLEKSGFEVVRVDLVGRTLTADRFLSNVGLMTRSNSVLRAMNAIGKHMQNTVLHVNVRDMQRIYCRAK